jgi:two-component system, chemotaxis family, response regulator Rcp1
MPKSLKVLWVEDNIGDILLINEAFEQAGLTHHLSVVNDGVQATDYLFRRYKFSRTSRPDLIILDLNLPKKSGREVIDEIKTDPDLIKIPLVVLTTSRSERDVLDGLDPKRCLYLVKPVTFDALIDLAKQIQDFLSSIPNPN